MGRRPIQVPDYFHDALVEMQREFKKQKGVEPSLGELVEEAFKEDPALSDVVEEKQREREKSEGSVWDEEFMKL